LIFVSPDALKRDPEARGNMQCVGPWVPGSMLRIAPE
jgi:hypothetical protein